MFSELVKRVYSTYYIDMHDSIDALDFIDLIGHSFFENFKRLSYSIQWVTDLFDFGAIFVMTIIILLVRQFNDYLYFAFPCSNNIITGWETLSVFE